MFQLLLDEIGNVIRKPTTLFFGIICSLAFVLNAGFLIWLATRRSDHGLASCPRCGRPIICPHCKDEPPED